MHFRAASALGPAATEVEMSMQVSATSLIAIFTSVSRVGRITNPASRLCSHPACRRRQRAYQRDFSFTFTNHSPLQSGLTEF